uniref:Uncharacterized protein n=1 Tax=Schistocephalus solidus TaxID=70667 RepID=A0A0X3PR35_SCHSO
MPRKTLTTQSQSCRRGLIYNSRLSCASHPNYRTLYFSPACALIRCWIDVTERLASCRCCMHACARIHGARTSGGLGVCSLQPCAFLPSFTAVIASLACQTLLL